jgi:hypothetical protein
VQTPHRHIPKLLVRDVPPDVALDWEDVERAGFLFGEFGILRANHVLTRVDRLEAPADLVARIRQGDGERISYAELVHLAEAAL